MVSKKFDIVGIGNSIVDIIIQVDESFIKSNGLRKGFMALSDLSTVENLIKNSQIKSTISGGSVANSIVCLSQNQIKSAFIGKVSNDELGDIFIQGLNKEEVFFANASQENDFKTGRCVIMVTDDAQRTMSTYLGISQKLNEFDINENIIINSNILYLEGYLWDLDDAQNAMKKAIKCAKENKTKVAFSVSDVFCIERFRDSFLNLISNDIDIIFANEEEVKSLFLDDNFDNIINKVKSTGKIFAITRGANGATIVFKDNIENIGPEKIKNLIDTTGAGDLFAAGFLEYFIQSQHLKKCGIRGVEMASKVIQQYGARL